MISKISELCILRPIDTDALPESVSSARLCELVAESGIRGKGWVGRPAASKWKTFAAAQVEKKEIICLISGVCANALMERNPTAVFAGAALTAKAFGIPAVWVVSDGTVSVPEQYGGVTFNSFQIEHSAASGEETRVIAAIEDTIPVAKLEPPYPEEKGLHGKPTLFHSAEFFAHIPYLLLGTDADTKLTFLTGDTQITGIAEIMLGTPLREILALAGCDSAKAVQTGGLTGCFIPGRALDTPYSPDSVFIGDGSIRVLSENRCIAMEVFKNCAEAYKASCGKCVFCREGSYQQYLFWRDIVDGRASDNDLKLLKTLSRVMSGTAACGYGQSIGAMVESALKNFEEEISQHVRMKKCPALVCPSMISVYIAPEKCTGCGKCISLCPEKAIKGGEGMIHVIDASICTRCLACVDCGEAIVRISSKLPKPALPENPVPVGSFVPKKKGLQRRVK